MPQGHCTKTCGCGVRVLRSVTFAGSIHVDVTDAGACGLLRKPTQSASKEASPPQPSPTAPNRRDTPDPRRQRSGAGVAALPVLPGYGWPPEPPAAAGADPAHRSPTS